MRLDLPAEGAQMMGFRFSLVLDFGVGAAARTRHGVRRGEDSAQRMEEARRAAVPPLSEDLGWGPLEPENFSRSLASPSAAVEHDNEWRRSALRGGLWGASGDHIHRKT